MSRKVQAPQVNCAMKELTWDKNLSLLFSGRETCRLSRSQRRPIKTRSDVNAFMPLLGCQGTFKGAIASSASDRSYAYRKDPLECRPSEIDVRKIAKSSSCYHSCIAAGASCPKGVCMVDEEFARFPLDNEPRFMIRKNRAGAMEFFDIEGASLCARRCESKLCETTTIE